MAKVNWKPGTMVYPVPAALVSCGRADEGTENLLTVAWIGTVCTNPPMLSVSIRPERYSHEIISRNMEFTVNLTTREMVRATDWCGVKSGRDFDKFKESGLTPLPGVMNRCPLIAESPLSIECRVMDVMRLGSHDLFIAKVINVVADDRFIDPTTGAMDLRAAELVSFCHGKYYGPGEELGSFGFSVRKRKKEKR